MTDPTLGARIRRRLAAAPAPEIARLRERVDALEEGLAESRRLHQRLSEVLDVVAEVLVPLADRDEDRLRERLASLKTTL